MKSWKMLAMVVMVMALVACSTGEKEVEAEAQVTVHGEPITLTDVTSIDDIMMNPDDYLDKVVLISGQVNGRCMGSGCWISIDRGVDHEGFIVRTEDESFIFPAECVDHKVTVQGKLQLKGPKIDEHAEAAVDHVCPNPEYYFYPMGIKIEA